MKRNSDLDNEKIEASDLEDFLFSCFKSFMIIILLVFSIYFIIPKIILWWLDNVATNFFAGLITVIILIGIAISIEIHRNKVRRKNLKEKIKDIYLQDSEVEKMQNIYEKIYANNRNNLKFNNKLTTRNLIVKEFLNEVDNGNITLEFVGEKRINNKNFKNDYSNFEDRANSVIIHNCFIGSIFKNIKLEILQIESSKIRSSHRSASVVPVFSGSFVVIDKNINNNMKIYFHGTKNNYNLKEYLKTNNIKFNKYFDIYAEEEANKFLTTDFLNFIADYREKYDIKFEIAFKDKIYIKFYTEDMFNYRYMRKNETDIVSVPQFYVITKFIRELVKILENY